MVIYYYYIILYLVKDITKSIKLYIIYACNIDKFEYDHYIRYTDYADYLIRPDFH